MRSRIIAAGLLLLIAGVAEAGLSKTARAWRNGPEMFLMTEDEKKVWKSLRSDAEAAAFIDLFWARRDPTPNTSRNEFREEFIERVRYSDGAFAEKRTRGAMSDRGQAYILLGPPEAGTREGMKFSGPQGFSSSVARSAESLVWTWPREKAVSLGVPKLSASFNQMLGTDTYARDTKHGQFSNVWAAAIEQNIVDREMTVAPAWASRVSKEIFAASSESAASTDEKARGRIGRLVLLSDLGPVDFDLPTDPIAALPPVDAFETDGDLAFVLEYCGGEGVLKIESKIRDLATGSESEPAPMKALPGCGAVPGMMSLSGLRRGTYELQVTTIETNGGRLATKQKFTIR